MVSKVTLEIEPTVLDSIITEETVDKLELKPGDKVYAIIKSTEVMLAKTLSKEAEENPEEEKTKGNKAKKK